MSVIKFRAWSIAGKRMYSWEQIIQNQGGMYKFLTWPDLYSAMQYTGLKDRDGQPIYEGDILMVRVESGYWRLGRVEFDDGCFVVKFDATFRCLKELMDGRMSVVGNIYKNTELLEANQCPKSN